ncbi:hypothetical protein VOM14_24270 [Paraburkholderia sp. MPAMCS5]|uniref:hypothetical protein n=1 Tax=Paraburkholderia sp. MPAMCS5 TaxID=3112563 RepID=UPI002E191E68|nr:hypothetical protein [Paraburkholderia sp. MPAMCS5]
MSTLQDSFGPPAISEPDFPGGALHAGLNLAPAGALQSSTSSLLATDTSLLPATDIDDADEFEPHVGLRLRNVLLAAAVVVAAGLAYVGYALFSDSQFGRSEPPADANQDARTTTGIIERYTPAQSAGSRPAALPGTSPGAAVAIAATPNVINLMPTAQEKVAVPARPATPQFRSAAQALQAAHAAFSANDLSAAQAALGAAQSLQPDNSAAQGLATEIKPLAARRDAALLAARLCADQQSWPCAREHANEALALDAGNDAAKTILERVIRETGWAPLSPQLANAGQVHKQASNK